MMQNIFIFGATSGIAEAVARIYASQGARLFLVARNSEKQNILASDLLARGASDVQIFIMDANELGRLPEMLDFAWNSLGHIDVALVAHGTLPDQVRCQTDIHYALSEFRTNANSVIACLTMLAQRFEKQADGTIAVIGSVAGDRGRTTNYWYGSAKSAVEAFASGLRGHLFKFGVHIITIKPGFVDTPMTKGLDLPKVLLASSDKVAKDIVYAIEKKRDVLYTPWYWRFIMLAIMHIPSMLFKRIKL